VFRVWDLVSIQEIKSPEFFEPAGRERGECTKIPVASSSHSNPFPSLSNKGGESNHRGGSRTKPLFRVLQKDNVVTFANIRSSPATQQESALLSSLDNEIIIAYDRNFEDRHSPRLTELRELNLYRYPSDSTVEPKRFGKLAPSFAYVSCADNKTATQRFSPLRTFEEA
jgi:hypothetical protein